jgi:hypothetical protein
VEVVVVVVVVVVVNFDGDGDVNMAGKGVDPRATGSSMIAD